MKTNREEILQSALQLFMSMNYERVSLQMITRMVGLTKTGIFNYYPTKLDLFVAVADKYLFNAQDPKHKYEESDGTLSDFIDKYVDGVERTMAEIVRLGNVRQEAVSRPMRVISISSSRYSSIILTARPSCMPGLNRSTTIGVALSVGLSKAAKSIGRPMWRRRWPSFASRLWACRSKCRFTRGSM